MEGGAWFLGRSPVGAYTLNQAVAALPHHPVAVRSIVASPFPGDGAMVYLGGFDANKAPAHDTAWIVRGTLPAALDGTPP